MFLCFIISFFVASYYFRNYGAEMLRAYSVAHGVGSCIKTIWLVLGHFKMDIAEVTTVELNYFLCHREDNNNSYTFVAGCYKQFFLFFKLLQFVRAPIYMSL